MAKPVTLVLGGTGVKGITSIGVLQSLHDHDIQIKKIVASGISALIAAQFALGEDPDKLTAQFTQFFMGNNRSLWGLEQATGILMNPRNGLSDNFSYFLRERNYCHANFQNNASLSWAAIDPLIDALFDNKTFADLKTPLAVSAIDLKQGNCIVIEKGSLKASLKAGIAYPGILPPVFQGKKELVSSTMYCELPLDNLRPEDGPVLAIDLPSPFRGTDPRSLLEVISIVDDIRCRAIKEKLLKNIDFVFSLKGLTRFRWGDYEQIPLIVAHARKGMDNFIKTNGLQQIEGGNKPKDSRH